jgi:F-type H+-transporting ATPase subunit delta
MTEIAKMYGGSLYDLAAEEGIEAQLLEELDAVVALLKKNPDYLHLLSMPNLPKKERCGLLDEAFQGQVHPYVLNFLKLLCENGTLRELNGCVRAFRVRYNKAHGVVEATAVSAVKLTAAQKTKLRKRLEEITGKQIDLSVKVDPTVLGGIRLDMEGVQLDGTVQHRLNALHNSIAEATL